MESVKKNTQDYRLYIYTFVVLSLLTILAVCLKNIRFSPAIATGLIMVIVIIQASIVLFYNMHLKFHEKILVVFVGLIFFLILVVLVITMLDYIYR